MAPRYSILRKLGRLARTDADRRALLIEAVFWLSVTRAALILIPFPRLATRLGVFVPPADPRVEMSRMQSSAEQAALAARIGWAVTRAARHVPFKAVCLPQAIAARQMLSHRGVASVLHFGVAKGEEKTHEAHAWLDAAGEKVTGYPVGDGFTEIACFV